MKPFYAQPILNSPYHEPTRHHALDENGQPLDMPPIIGRRRSRYMVPVPAARRQKVRAVQAELLLDDEGGGETRYNPSVIVNEIRSHVSAWRKLPHSADWGVTPTTQRLLQHWRHYNFQNQRPFFCQVEAVETAIWLHEVARGKNSMPTSSERSRPQMRRQIPDCFASR